MNTKQKFTPLHRLLHWIMAIAMPILFITGFFPDWKANIETVHKWGIYWFPIFILLHLTGIIIAELSTKKGITSKMIGGD